MKNIKTKLLKTLAVLGMGFAGAVHAVTPANTTITNTAELTYTGLTNPIQATVSITVDLTPSAPVLSAPPDQTAAENQSVSYVYTVTSTANGSDIYNLGDSLTPTNLASTSTNAVFTQGVSTVTSITLGATAAAATASIGSFTISVPSDGVADAAVNNLVASDTVVIGGNAYTIQSVSDDGVNASITLTSSLTTAVSIGDLIAEQQTFTATIPDVGSVSPSGPSDVIMDVTATSDTDTGQTTLDQTQTVIVEVTFEKFVRNVFAPSGTTPTIINGQNYGSTAGNITAVSGDTLEYAIRVTAPGSTTLTGVAITDSIPAFTTYVANSTFLNGSNAGGCCADIAGVTPLVTGMSVNDAGSAIGSGTVTAGTSAVVTFQVTVD